LGKAQLELFEGSLGSYYREVLAKAELIIGKTMTRMLGYKGFEAITSGQDLIEGLLAEATSQQIVDFGNVVLDEYGELEDPTTLRGFLMFLIS